MESTWRRDKDLLQNLLYVLEIDIGHQNGRFGPNTPISTMLLHVPLVNQADYVHPSELKDPKEYALYYENTRYILKYILCDLHKFGVRTQHLQPVTSLAWSEKDSQLLQEIIATRQYEEMNLIPYTVENTLCTSASESAAQSHGYANGVSPVTINSGIFCITSQCWDKGALTQEGPVPSYHATQQNQDLLAHNLVEMYDDSRFQSKQESPCYTQPAVSGSFNNADFTGRSRDMTEVLPRPTKTLPPLEWDKDDPVAAKLARNTLAARKSRARMTSRVERMGRRIADLEWELKKSQEEKKFWMEQAQNRDQSSAPPSRTFQSTQVISSSSKVSNRVLISNLIEPTSTGACEPRDCIPSLEARACT
ncbi:hypothetical protein AtubIFM56815_009508 [Aspergillus tubingensis]|uniref:BZIP domain-containing protein n=1 Tax=Aspergillus tubingensis TaxID=5068 RepID=A0A9W6EKJ1_ASPTU|nr:hypothetical protein AtubIFM56815_009508 [Aspergillus tubingensis]GLB00737.1 hypothetical protein AtubIFM57143_009790 [Aspergillus tubingensis]